MESRSFRTHSAPPPGRGPRPSKVWKYSSTNLLCPAAAFAFTSRQQEKALLVTAHVVAPDVRDEAAVAEGVPAREEPRPAGHKHSKKMRGECVARGKK